MWDVNIFECKEAIGDERFIALREYVLGMLIRATYMWTEGIVMEHVSRINREGVWRMVDIW